MKGSGEDNVGGGEEEEDDEDVAVLAGGLAVAGVSPRSNLAKSRMAIGCSVDSDVGIDNRSLASSSPSQSRRYVRLDFGVPLN